MLSDTYRTYYSHYLHARMISSRGNSNYCRDELRLKTFPNIKSGSVRRRAKNISQHERLILGDGRHFLPRYAHVVSAPPRRIKRAELPRESRF